MVEPLYNDHPTKPQYDDQHPTELLYYDQLQNPSRMTTQQNPSIMTTVLENHSVITTLWNCSMMTTLWNPSIMTRLKATFFFMILFADNNNDMRYGCVKIFVSLKGLCFFLKEMMKCHKYLSVQASQTPHYASVTNNSTCKCHKHLTVQVSQNLTVCLKQLAVQV